MQSDGKNVLSTRRTGPVRRVVSIAIAASVTLIILYGMFSSRTGGHDGMPLKCSSNLRMIGLAMKMYANVNGNAYPPSFAELLLTQEITAGEFVCPASKTETRATGPTTRATAESLVDPSRNHCSYIYVGNVLRDEPTADDAVLAFDAKPNRSFHFTHASVLFGDGHVDTLITEENADDARRHEQLLADHAAGVRPLRLRP